MSIGEIYNKIKPYIAKDFNLSAVGGTITQVIQQLVPHALSGSYHTGTLNKTQAPWVATDIADAVTLHTSDEDAHHNANHDIIGDTHFVTGNTLDIVGLDTANNLALLVPSSNPGVSSKILKSDTAGKVEVEGLTTNEINADDDLYIQPTGQLYLDSAENSIRILPDNDIQTDNFASQATGWRLTYSGELDARYMYADQMKIKQLIVDTESALAGSEIITKSAATLARDFYAPYPGFKTHIYVEDLQNAEGMAAFESGDYLKISEFSRSAGSLTALDAWGIASAYNDQAEKLQRWTFTRDGSVTINAVTYQSAATDADASVTSFIIPKGLSTLTGDLLVVFALFDDETVEITDLNGFAIHKEEFIPGLKGFVLSRVVAGGDGSTYTLTINHVADCNVSVHRFRNALTVGEVATVKYETATDEFTAGRLHNLSDYDYLLLLTGTIGEPEFTEPELWVEVMDFATGIGISHHSCVIGGLDNGYVGNDVVMTDFDCLGISFLVDIIPTYSGLNLTTGYLPPGSKITAKAASVIDFGISGNGYIESTTIDGAYGSNSPYIRIATWSGHPTTKTVRTQVGRLRGIFAEANEYGLFAGEGATVNDKYLRLSSYTSIFNNIPIKMVTSSTERIRLDASYGLDLQLAASADTLTAITWRSSVGIGSPVVSIDAFDGGDSTQLIVDLDAISDSPTGVTIVRANNYAGTSTASLTLTAPTTSATSNAVLNGNNVGLGNSSTTDKVTIRVKSTGYTLIDGDTRIVGGLDISDVEEFMPANGGLSVGSRAINYSPTTSNWYTNGCTIVLTGQNYSVIGFHDAAERVDFIRVGQSTMVLGYDGGWGSPYVTIPGGLLINRGAHSNGALTIGGTAYNNHFNYSSGEDTYIRGGKITSKVLINDAPGGDVEICGGGGATIIWGRLGSAWNGLSFGSGWANYGGAYQTGQYKKVGDFVFLRGLVKRTSGTGVSIATLPSGHRPPAQCLIGVLTNTGIGRVDIQTDGQIVYSSGGVDWMQLDSLNFSTL